MNAARFHSRSNELPVEIKPHRHNVRIGLAERRVRTGHRVDPIEHDADAIGPVPVEADGQVVVLAAIDFIEIEVRRADLEFPRAPAARAGHEEEIRVRHVAAELGAVLAESLEDAILAGEEVTQVRVRAVQIRGVARRQIDSVSRSPSRRRPICTCLWNTRGRATSGNSAR